MSESSDFTKSTFDQQLCITSVKQPVKPTLGLKKRLFQLKIINLINKLHQTTKHLGRFITQKIPKVTYSD